jgi:hypothetical protein
MIKNKNPEDILDVNKAWLPPSPHVERVVEMVVRGRAHIEDRGHELPPLVVFEDGGAIELPNVRYIDTHRGIEIVSAAGSSGADITKHPDVCGCIDELRGLAGENPDNIGSSTEHFRKLVADALYMVDRMRKRLDDYNQFFAEIIEAASKQENLPDAQMAHQSSEAIFKMLEDIKSGSNADIEELFRLAEQIRDVAARQEAALYSMRDRSIAIGDLYSKIKGSRNWKNKQD